MNKTISNHAAAAKCIRAELKKEFPNVKFMVRAEKYTGGASIGITWKNGPTRLELMKIAGKYYDSTELTIDRKDFPQVNYVLYTRLVN